MANRQLLYGRRFFCRDDHNSLKMSGMNFPSNRQLSSFWRDYDCRVRIVPLTITAQMQSRPNLFVFGVTNFIIFAIEITSENRKEIASWPESSFFFSKFTFPQCFRCKYYKPVMYENCLFMFQIYENCCILGKFCPSAFRISLFTTLPSQISMMRLNSIKMPSSKIFVKNGLFEALKYAKFSGFCNFCQNFYISTFCEDFPTARNTLRKHIFCTIELVGGKFFICEVFQ